MSNIGCIYQYLNPYCLRALNDAAILCRSLGHAEILLEHWLYRLLEQGHGDISVLAERYKWEESVMIENLDSWFSHRPWEPVGKIRLSRNLESLLKQALLECLMDNESEIRSVHVLMALGESSNLIYCNSLCALLTLSKAHLKQLLHVLEARSDERGAEQIKERVLMASMNDETISFMASMEG